MNKMGYHFYRNLFLFFTGLCDTSVPLILLHCNSSENKTLPLEYSTRPTKSEHANVVLPLSPWCKHSAPLSRALSQELYNGMALWFLHLCLSRINR